MKHLFARFSYKIHRVDLQSLYAVNLYRCSCNLLPLKRPIYSVKHKKFEEIKII